MYAVSVSMKLSGSCPESAVNRLTLLRRFGWLRILFANRGMMGSGDLYTLRKLDERVHESRTQPIVLSVIF